MKKRKIKVIDVSNMSEKEMCELLNIEYIPWYKSSFFWGVFLICIMPVLVILLGD